MRMTKSFNKNKTKTKNTEIKYSIDSCYKDLNNIHITH